MKLLWQTILLVAETSYAAESLHTPYQDDEPVPEPWWSISRADTTERAMMIGPQYYEYGGQYPLGKLDHDQGDCSAPTNVEMVLVTDNQDPRYGRLLCTWEPPSFCAQGTDVGCYGVYIHSPGVKWGNRSILPHEEDGSRPPVPNKFNGRGFMYRNLKVDGPPGKTTCEDGYLCVEEYLGKYAFTLPKYRFNWSFGGRLHYPIGDDVTVDDFIAQGGPNDWNYQHQPNDIPFYSQDDLPNADNYWTPRQSAPPTSMEVNECWVMANSYSEGQWPPPEYAGQDTIPSDVVTSRCGQYHYDLDGTDEDPLQMAGREGYMSLGHRDTEWSEWGPLFPKTGELSVAGHERIAKHSYDTRVTSRYGNAARGAWNRYVMDIFVDPTYHFRDESCRASCFRRYIVFKTTSDDLGPEGMIWKLHGDKITQNWCQKGIQYWEQVQDPSHTPQGSIADIIPEEELKGEEYSHAENTECKSWYMRNIILQHKKSKKEGVLDNVPGAKFEAQAAAIEELVDELYAEEILAPPAVVRGFQDWKTKFETHSPAAVANKKVSIEVVDRFAHLMNNHFAKLMKEMPVQDGTYPWHPTDLSLPREFTTTELTTNWQSTTGNDGVLNTNGMTAAWPPGFSDGTFAAWPSNDQVTGFATNKGPFFDPPKVDYMLTVDATREWTTLPAYENTGTASIPFEHREIPHMDPHDIYETYDLRRPKEELLFWYPRPATFYDGAYLGAQCESPWGLCDLQGDSQRTLYQSNIKNINSCDWKQLHASPNTPVIRCAEVP